jgi:hypothetical protein
VLTTPEEEREYSDSSHFKIMKQKKKNGDWIEIIIYVHDQGNRYLVYGIHGQPIG